MFEKKELIRTSSSNKYYKYRNALLNANISFCVKKSKSKLPFKIHKHKRYIIYAYKHNYKKAIEVINALQSGK